jgi:hypothetical protein
MRLTLGSATLLVHLIRAGSNLAQGACGRIHFLQTVFPLFVRDQPIAQAFITEVALLVCDPVMEPAVRAMTN